MKPCGITLILLGRLHTIKTPSALSHPKGNSVRTNAHKAPSLKIGVAPQKAFAASTQLDRI